MDRDQQLIEALVAAQVESGGEDRLLAFYERLVRAIQSQKATLQPTAPFPLSPDESAARLQSGTPLLSFDSLGVTIEAFLPWLRSVAALFDSYDPGAADELEAVEEEALLTLARRWIEAGETGYGPALDALIANALAPWLEQATAAIAPQMPLKQWSYPYCPMCGGFPDFALWDSERQSRDLLCERCQASWRFLGPGCLFCGEADADLLGYYSTEDDLYRVDVCDSCGHYIKMMDRHIAREAKITPLPVAERLLTPGLDVMAAQEGYTRPSGFLRGAERLEDEDE